MSDLIVFKIAWSKVDTNLLYRGEKDDYLSGALKYHKDGRDKYGWDGMVTQDVSKEDRAAGVRGPIIGNFKHIGTAPQRQQEQPDDRAQQRRPEPPQRRERPLPTRPSPGTHGRRQEPEKRSYSHDDPDADPNF